MRSDPGIAKRVSDRHNQEQVDVAVGLSVAERLTRRAKSKTIELTLSDSEGDFVIKLHNPTRKELDKLLKYQTAIQNPDEQVAANEHLCGMLGKLCIDDSLNSVYWLNADYDLDDLVVLIQKLFENFVKIIKEAESFRSNGNGARAVSDVRTSGEVPS